MSFRRLSTAAAAALIAAFCADLGMPARLTRTSGRSVETPGVGLAASEGAGGAAAERVPAERAAPQPPEIYYDLTHFDWYRRGEPLVVDGRGYEGYGRPGRGALAELRPAGRYDGVAYYAQAKASAPLDTLYVPVFEGYWQRFVPAAGEPQR